MAQNKKNIHTKLELSVFLFLIIPSMLFSYINMQPADLGFLKLAIFTIFRDLGIFFLVLFFLWHNKEPFNEIGLTNTKLGDEAILGGFLFFPVFFFITLIQNFFQKFGFELPQKSIEVLTGPKDSLQLTLAVILVIVVAITEETIFRGYLVNRFEKITGNKLSALFLSTAIFASGHGYEGTVGIILVSLLGLTYGAIYIWRGSLTAPVIMHLLQNSLGLIFSSQ